MLATFAKGRRSGVNANRAAKRAGERRATVRARLPYVRRLRRAVWTREGVAEVIEAIQGTDRWAMHHGRNRLGAIGAWLFAIVFFIPFAFTGLATVWGIRVPGG